MATYADGLVTGSTRWLADIGQLAVKELCGELTLTGGLTMTTQHRNILRIDPGGAGRTILLPTEAHGMWFLIINSADAAETLTVKDDANAITVATLLQNQAGLVFCDQGGTWRRLVSFTVVL